MNTIYNHLLVTSVFLLSIMATIHAQNTDGKVRIIMIGAHPDDCDEDGGGTAALFAQMGYAVKFVSVTNGDAGHQTLKGKELAKRRFAETQESGKRLGVTYDVLDNHDGLLMPTLDVRLAIIRKIREWNADVVIAPARMIIILTIAIPGCWSRMQPIWFQFRMLRRMFLH